MTCDAILFQYKTECTEIFYFILSSQIMFRGVVLCFFAFIAYSHAACVDKRNDCDTYKSQCDHPTVQYWCEKTCGKCKQEETTTTKEQEATWATKAGCQDSAANCDALSVDCKTRADVRKYCVLTCGLCTPTTTPPPKCEDKSRLCPTWAKQGACEKVKLKCKESCGLCH